MFLARLIQKEEDSHKGTMNFNILTSPYKGLCKNECQISATLRLDKSLTPSSMGGKRVSSDGFFQEFHPRNGSSLSRDMRTGA